MKPHTFYELTAWQRGVDLVEHVYQLTAKFPREEMFSLTAQARRAAISIPSNIAEGHGRRSDGDFRRFLLIANGSLSELKTHLAIASRLSFVSDAALKDAQKRLDEVGRLVNGLHRSLASKRGRSFSVEIPDSDTY